MILAIDTSQMTYSIVTDNGLDVSWSDIKITLYDQLKPIDIASVEALIINIGPGRFSGLRSGIAFAQGIARAKSIKIHAVNQFELLASQRSELEFTIALDARKNEAYIQSFKNGKANSAISIVAQSSLNDIIQLYGNIYPAIPLSADAKTLLRYYKHNDLKATSMTNLKPVYVRPSV